MASSTYTPLRVVDEDETFESLSHAIEHSLSPASRTVFIPAEIRVHPPTPSNSNTSEDTLVELDHAGNGAEALSTLESPAEARAQLAPVPTSVNASDSLPDYSALDDNHSITSSTSSLKSRLKYAAAPWVHEIRLHDNTDSSIPGTARKYDHWTQCKRLWRLATGEWLITAALCGVYAGILVLFARHLSLGPNDRSLFNALVTAVSFFLGVNLSASFRSYAKLLRWLLLSECYRPLSEFDLILSCESILNVLKLTLKARNTRFKFLPSRTQVLCVIWLLMNLSMPLCVGLIGLTYNMVSAQAYNKMQNGNVSFLDFSALQTDCYNCDLNNIQIWGLRGFNAEHVFSFDHKDARDDRFMYHSTENGTTQHWLESYAPSDNQTFSISFRKIRSEATCQEREVISGGDGTSTDFTIIANDGPQVIKFPGDAPGPAGLTVWGTINETCGPRNACIDVFLAEADINANQPMPVNNTGRFFQCNNTVLPVMQWKKGVLMQAPVEFQVSDQVAQMLAGAIAWSGNPISSSLQSNKSVLKSTTYMNSTAITWQIYKSYGNYSLTELDMADFLSSFTMKAITAMDDFKTGMDNFKTAYGRTPIASQQLVVDWLSAISLFVGIPLVQLVALVVVFCVANKAIIKDESPLSIAKLYFTLLQNHGFGTKGCMLKGVDIVQEMGDPSVTYGWVNGVPGVGHLDVFEKEQALQTEDGRAALVSNVFRRGIMYDGTGPGILNRQHGGSASNKYRDFDAGDWFA